MYGHMYNDEKVQPLAKKAWDAACKEYNKNRPVQTDEDELTTEEKSKMPQYVVYWGAISQELYAKETPEVKLKVAQAVQEQVDKAKVLRDGPLSEEDTDQKAARLDA